VITDQIANLKYGYHYVIILRMNNQPAMFISAENNMATLKIHNKELVRTEMTHLKIKKISKEEYLARIL